MRSFFFTAIAFLFAAQLHAGNGNTYPQNYFRNPLDIPIQLAGNFGELRPNHFHTGVDITTHGQEGLPVHAAADGYISRIKITPWGYGKAIYVTHPNGYTTVYGHLSAYNGNIAAYVEKNQYINESFEIELFPSPGELPVKKGDVIAFSGNTGSSGGPHVHFEIRDTKTEDAINPLLFGLPVKDDVAPVAVSLVVCPAEPGAVVNGQNGTYRIPLKASGGGYVFANPKDSIVAYGRIGFAIEGYDKESVPKGKNGVYAVRLQMENKTICS
ncbi:MAG TPA: M23 family metallopeptidase, partial [Bacteroidia bacterium]|nr:M23 family metallopeptidase [Bacteroidia bacterium]